MSETRASKQRSAAAAPGVVGRILKAETRDDGLDIVVRVPARCCSLVYWGKLADTATATRYRARVGERLCVIHYEGADE